ncbi:MAG: hypothetical protein Q8930_10145, partial [Bacillota bacterium]|nr:hypothetical protein [Bacillota bacterium]
MRSKKVLSLTLALLIISTTTAFAKGNDKGQAKGKSDSKVVQQDKVSTGEAKKQEAQQKKADKKDQIEAFKTGMREKHAAMKDLKDQIKTLKDQIQQERQQLEKILAQLKSGEKTLPPDMLTQLMTAADNLKLDVEDVKDTVEVDSEVKDTQEKVEKQDFNNALASMDKVIAKFQHRLDALKQLKADLDAALAIVNNAAAPAPGTTSPATSEPAATGE